MKSRQYRITNYSKFFHAENQGLIGGPLLVIIGLIFAFGSRGDTEIDWSIYIGLFFVFIGVLSFYFSFKFRSKLKEFSTGEMYKVKATVIGYKTSRSSRQIQVKYEIDGHLNSCILSVYKYNKLSKVLHQLKNVIVFVPIHDQNICFLEGYVDVEEIKSGQ